MRQTAQNDPPELRRLLIDAALRILADPETPLDLRKVAEAAGKSRTAPYLVFGKETEGGGLSALRLAVAAEGVQMLTGRMEAALQTTDDPRLAFNRIVAALLSFATHHERLFRLMFGPEIGTIPIAEGTAMRRHPEFGNLVRARLGAERVIVRAIEKAQAERILPEGDPVRLTMGAWALMIGIAFLLLDRVLEAAGVRTSAETGAELATGLLMGAAAEPVTRAALALVAAQKVKGEELPPEPADLPEPSSPAEPFPDAFSASRPLPGGAERAWSRLDRRPSRAHERVAQYGRATRAITRFASLRRAALVAPALKGARVLWVDDDPAGNRWERETLEALGVDVTTARSTIEALKRLSAHPFDLILSDISRDGTPDEGLIALPRLQHIAPDTPVLFYAGRVDPARGTPAGAAGITDRPDELLHLVLDVLERRRL